MKGAAPHRVGGHREGGRRPGSGGRRAVCAAQEVAQQQGRRWVLLEDRHCAIP